MMRLILSATVLGLASILFAYSDAQAQSDPSVLPTMEYQTQLYPVEVEIAQATGALVDTSNMVDPTLIAAYVIGGEDINTWYYFDLDMPPQILDEDGGEIRLIMQHELSAQDQVRVIEITVGCEWTNDRFGKRGRLNGRYCWHRQTGGGEHAWILGDTQPHSIWGPWGWAHIVDYRWGENNTPLGNNRIRIFSHPHVTSRFLFYD